MSIDNIVFINNLPSLDLHGFTKDFAIIAINEFIKDNIKLQNENIVIVHGKGTGALRKGVASYLKGVPYVKSFRLGEVGEGDAGVTIVEFK